MSEQRGDLPPGTILGMMLNENARLRAELAAEKEDVWKMRDVALRAITGAIAAERQRCAKIADVIAEEGKLTTCYWRLRKVAAAIRASNAAPPQTEVSLPRVRAEEILRKLEYVAAAFKGDKQTRDTLIPCLQDALRHAAPPHVEPCPYGIGEKLPMSHIEPSAAESDRQIEVVARAIEREGCGDESFWKTNAEQAARLLAILKERGWSLVPSTTEARMLELARRTEKRPTSGNGRDLAAEVLKAFGVKK